MGGEAKVTNVRRKKGALRMKKRADQERLARWDGALVALLDVLGARVHDSETALRIATSMVALVDTVNLHIREDMQRWTAGIAQPQVRVFGDTIVIIWCSDQWEPEQRLMSFGSWLQVAFVQALEAKIALRGAVGYGELVVGEATALGPALTDAAAWYEVADALGVVASPRCGLLCETFATEDSEESAAASFVRTQVPLTHGGPRAMWALSWPYHLHWDTAIYHQDITSRARLLRLLAAFQVPMGVESKYHNTISFFDGFVKSWPQVIGEEEQLGELDEEEG